nr:hypothetical protein [uncultured Campylobacter sp.]
MRVLKSSVANLLAFSKCGFCLNLIKFMVVSMREQNTSNLPSNLDANSSRGKASKIKRGFRNFTYNLKS